MLHMEIISVCYQINTKHLNILRWQKVEFLIVKLFGTGLHTKIQSVPHSKHTPSRLYKPVS